MLKISPYVRTVIDMVAFLKDTHNRFRMVSQKPYDGTEKGNGIGTNCVLQVLTDDRDPGRDKDGNPLDNNVLENFNVTILCGQPHVPHKKGDIVSLEGFIPEKSYYIDHNPILRFAGITAAKTKED